MYADVRDQASVAAAVVGADAVVNAVSAYVEKGGVTFEAVHEQGAKRRSGLGICADSGDEHEAGDTGSGRLLREHTSARADAVSS